MRKFLLALLVPGVPASLLVYIFAYNTITRSPSVELEDSDPLSEKEGEELIASMDLPESQPDHYTGPRTDDELYAALDREVPDWEELEKRPGFEWWLGHNPDIASNYDAGFETFDTAMIAGILEDYDDEVSRLHVAMGLLVAFPIVVALYASRTKKVKPMTQPVAVQKTEKPHYGPDEPFICGDREDELGRMGQAEKDPYWRAYLVGAGQDRREALRLYEKDNGIAVDVIEAQSSTPTIQTGEVEKKDTPP